MTEKLFFIRLIGMEDDEFYRYEFYFVDDLDNVMVEDYEYKPCCLSLNVRPIIDSHVTLGTVKTRIKLNLIQESCCMSFKDAMQGIVAIAWESLDGYDEYPQDGRLVFHYGEDMDDVERKLAMKSIIIMDGKP